MRSQETIKQIKDLVKKLGLERPELSIQTREAKASDLYDLSVKLRKMYETECSYPEGQTDSFKAAVKRTEERVDAIFKELKVNYKFQQDPRGTSVRIFWTYETPPPYNTMGGVEAGWGIG